MRHTKILYFGLSLLTFFACKKKHETPSSNATVQGYVIDPWTDDTLGAGFEIEIWEASQPRNQFIENFDKVIATGTTDENGFFSINYRGAETYYLYAARATKQHYMTPEEGSIFRYKLGDIDDVLVGAFPLRWVIFEVKNTPPVNPTDTFVFGDFYTNPLDTIIGAADTTIVITHTPLLTNGNYFYDIVNETYNDRFFINADGCPSLDTCTVQINY